MEWQEIDEIPYGEVVLLFVPGTGVTFGRASSGEFVIDEMNGFRETYASHWMPLPEAPNAR